MLIQIIRYILSVTSQALFCTLIIHKALENKDMAGCKQCDLFLSADLFQC